MEPLVREMCAYWSDSSSSPLSVREGCKPVDEEASTPTSALVGQWVRSVVDDAYHSSVLPPSARGVWLSQMDTLLDAFQADSAQPPAGPMTGDLTVARQALVLQVLAAVLRELVASTVYAAGTQTDNENENENAPARRRRIESNNSGSTGAAAAAAVEEEGDRTSLWSLQNASVTDGFLMLALFYAECSSVDNLALVRPMHDGLAALFELVLPMLLREEARSLSRGGSSSSSDHNAGNGSDQSEEVVLLGQEVRSLRVMMAKRLERFATYSRGSSRHIDAPELFQSSLWCLRAYYDAIAETLVEAAAGERLAAEAPPQSSTLSLTALAERIGTELTDISVELIRPISATVNAVVRNAAVAKSTLVASEGLIPTASPLLLSTALRELERVLWMCQAVYTEMAHVSGEHGDTLASSSSSSSSRLASLLSSVVHRLISDLLHTCQLHAQTQQRLQAENLRRGDGVSGVGGGPHGGATSTANDPFGTFTVQRGVQAVLSVALEKLPLELLHTSTLRSAATAALTACGGPLLFRSGGESVVLESVANGESAVSVMQNAVRPCRAVLEAKRAGHGRRGRRGRGDPDDAYDEQEAVESDEDMESAGTLRGAGSLLSTSFGRYSSADLTEMVLQSLALVDLLQAEDVQVMHVEGLQTMQHKAALQAQREELERRRQIEREDVEAVPPAQLLARVNTNVLQTTGTELLRRHASRAQLERAAFRSVLLSYQPTRTGSETLSMESEAQVRVKQALLARCLVQLPTVYLDAAIDELLLRLRYELKALLREPRRRQEQLQLSGDASADSSAQKAWAAYLRTLMNRLRDGYRSAYALVLQVLFTAYAALAPTHEERHIALLENADADIGGAAPLLDDHLGGGVETSAGSVVLQSGAEAEEELAGLDTERPVGFLLDDNGTTADEDPQSSVGGGRKRSAAGRDRGGFSSRGFFHDDTPRQPSMFSHILCRVMEVVLPLDRVLVLHILLEVPCLTRHVWHYIFDSFCLSQDELRCYTGIALLTDLAVRREAYRRNAVQLLLHLCVSPNSSARRLSIQKVGKLLSASDPVTPSKRLIGDDTVKLLVEHAKLKVAAIPAFRLSPAGAEVDVLVSTAYAETGDMERALACVSDPRRIQLYQRELEKLTGQLHTHLGLFLMLCVREPRELLPAILQVYQQCVERNNRLMARLLLENEDIHKMMLYLPHTNPLLFLLLRYSGEAGVFVQTLLQSRLTQIGREAEAANKAKKSASTAEEEEAAVRTLHGLHDQVAAILTMVISIWKGSVIPLVEDNRGPDGGLYSSGHISRPVLHDFRFLAPLVAFLSGSDLKTKYLPQFLYFVQVQMALQKTEEYELRKLSAKERQFVMTKRELHQFIFGVIREIFLRHPIQVGIGKERGTPGRLKRVDLLYYLYYAPEHTKQTEMNAIAAAERGSRHEIQSLVCPRISQITTKEVINACFELSVEVPAGAPGEEPVKVALFDLKEIQAAIRRVMQNTKEGVPSQFLTTLLFAAPRLVRTHGREFLQMVRQLVLEPLAARWIWESNIALWTGVLHFTDAYYPECHSLLLHLPDQVLTKALRDFPMLFEKFYRENENNASFTHIFEGLTTSHMA